MVKQSRAMLLWVAAGVRAFFIVYGEWQDRQMEVAYTDVDYKVYSDASALMAKGRSPFERDTYRYSPLIALLLLPNALLHPSWGKILFSLADLMVGDIIYKILRSRGVPDSSCVKCMALWLFNPFTFTIATRGSCESIPCCMILWVLFCLLTGRVLEAAIYYGLVVHLRIYPIIYVFAILIVLDGGHTKTTKKSEGFVDFDHNTDRKSVDGGFMLFALLRKLINRDRVVFGLVSGGLFFALTGISYIFYGDKFLFEALLYHLTRTDHRHNFSIYFYHIYLHHGLDFTTVERLVSFVPQFVVQAFLTTYFAQDLPFCFFVQTVAFVAFNKVITAQYFVWFFCLLPLILPWTNLRLRWKGSLSIALWTCSQLHWLAWAYELEFQGRNVFLQLWSASLLCFLANILVLSTLINNHSFPASLMPNDNKKD